MCQDVKKKKVNLYYRDMVMFNLRPVQEETNNKLYMAIYRSAYWCRLQGKCVFIACGSAKIVVLFTWN